MCEHLRIRQQLLHRRPCGRLHDKHRLDHTREISRVARWQWRHTPAFHTLVQRLHGRSIEGAVERGHLEQHTTQRPHISLAVVRPIRPDLGGKVVRRPYRGNGHRIGRFQKFCYTQVADLSQAIVCEEDICRLDISVKDRFRVEILQPQTDLDEETPDCLFREIGT